MKITQPTLFVVATPLGNLEDITLRALRVLKETPVIFAEDTRRARKLLDFYKINSKIVSYHQHSQHRKKELIKKLLEENLSGALLCDAGTPGISDPGNELIEFLLKEIPSLKIVPLPGPSAVIAAASISGFPMHKFLFLGFPPVKKRRKQFFEEIQKSKYPVIFYESCHRIIKTLNELENFVGSREIVVCRELTKIHESIYRGSAEQVASLIKKDSLKGEFTVVVRGI